MVLSDSDDDDSDDESACESVAPSHQEGDFHPSGGDLSVEEEYVDFEPQQDDAGLPVQGIQRGINERKTL
jgi:hypothetical protein